MIKIFWKESVRFYPWLFVIYGIKICKYRSQRYKYRVQYYIKLYFNKEFSQYQGKWSIINNLTDFVSESSYSDDIQNDAIFNFFDFCVSHKRFVAWDRKWGRKIHWVEIFFRIFIENRYEIERRTAKNAFRPSEWSPGN